MGVVYAAKDRDSGQRVAIKLLLGRNDLDRHRFEREADILGRLDHRGIVRYRAGGESGLGEPFLAMEWLDGISLRELLGQRELGVRQTARVVRKAAEALAAAH